MQALHLAVQAMPKGTMTEQTALASEYFATLVELRSSGEFRETFLKYHKISNKI